MSDCGVCIGVEPEGYCEFCVVEVRTGRKPHKCSECEKQIVPGERYEHARGKHEGEMWASDTCLACAEIAEAFYCHGRIFGGQMWEEMEYCFAGMTIGCLNRLASPAAKEELLRRWNEWKFGKPKE